MPLQKWYQEFPKLLSFISSIINRASKEHLGRGLLRSLLLEQLVLQLIGQALRMLWTSGLSGVNVALPSSSGVEVLPLHAGSECYLGNGNLVFALGGGDFWGSDC